MVQVDVFWGYGWGASLAMAAAQQLKHDKKPLENKYFVATLTFLSLFWAPTGMLLLIRHPSWETMQAAESFSAMSEWLILAFGVTNVTQGMLGYWVGQKLIAAGKTHWAHLNWILGYFGMFFILLYGWDGLGYDRFLYDRDMLPGSPAWTPGAGVEAAGALAAIWNFVQSSAAITLYIDGVYLLPPFGILVWLWRREADRAAGRANMSPWKLLASYLSGVFIVGLGSAAFCAVTVRGVAYALGVGDHVARGLGQIPANTGMHVLAYLIGLPLALGVLWFAFLKEGRLAAKMLAPLDMEGDSSPKRSAAL